MSSLSDFSLSVAAELLASGSYTAVVHVGEDMSRALDRDEAFAYAAEIVRVAGQADFAAAMTRQAVSVGASKGDAVAAFTRMYTEHGRLADDAATHPVKLMPGFGDHPFPSFVTIYIGDEEVAQCGTGEARAHAADVLEALSTAELCTAFRRDLIGSLGYPESVAEEMVARLPLHTDTATKES